MTAPDPQEGVRLPVVYVGLEDVVVAHANHFVLQFDRGDYILTVGQVELPMLLGDVDDQREQMRQIAYAPARALARVVLTGERVQELRDLLNAQLAQHESDAGGLR